MSSVRLSIIIKALNEERHIERSIVSALAAIDEIGGTGEVVLADSLSTDGTLAIASRFDIRVVQLTQPEDRSCGIGAQLGMLVAGGDFLYVLDGDMALLPGFMPKALEALEADACLAGVAGLVEDKVVANYAFKMRVARKETAVPSASPVCLNMGGLYRRRAIEQVGYFTNRNLHSFEEFELGARLRQAGWQLRRLDFPAVLHYGPAESSTSLMLRRWRTRYACGHGELFRQALGEPHFALVATRLSVFRVQAFTVVVWLVLSVIATATLGPAGAVVLVVGCWLSIAAMLALKKRSISQALYSIMAWHIGVAAFVRGLFIKPRCPPDAPIAHRLVQ